MFQPLRACAKHRSFIGVDSYSWGFIEKVVHLIFSFLKKKAPHSARKGFTLIELMFVVFVIALLAKVMLPRVANLFRVNLKTSAVQLAGYMQSAYEYAVLRHKRVRVQFDLNEGTYWAELASDDAPAMPLITENSKLDDVLMELEKKAAEPLPTDEEALKEQFEKLSDGPLRPSKLPNGVKFKSIRLADSKNDKTSWLEFSPTGFSQKAIVSIEHESGTSMSISLPVLGGRSVVEKGDADFAPPS